MSNSRKFCFFCTVSKTCQGGCHLRISCIFFHCLNIFPFSFWKHCKHGIAWQKRASLGCHVKGFFVSTSLQAIRVHIYLYSLLHTDIHTYLPTYLHTYIHTYILTYLHTYILTYLHTYIHTYILAYILTYFHTYLHTYILTYLHTYILTYLHT